MKRKFPFFFTAKGCIFGSIFLGVFVVAPLTIIITHFYFGLHSGILAGILAGVVIGISFRYQKYWDWADRVMARFFGLFGSNSSK